ncbi:hypothetical protein [Micromonospora sp. AP08]|uniref:hypothetical protein n=1 Tax=Micromonospora sp. AP08 TaxID=2604467 RepID=UPI00165250BA|nr:hypothetical protein [Micromonospora sp. AP08]
MTGTPDDDVGSRGGETDDTGPAADTGEPAPSGQVPDRREQWLTRARELWAVIWRGAKRLWTAVRPILDQMRWQEAEASPVTLVDRRVAPTLLVPALGQVYHFVVRATFTWSSDNARPELFGWYVDQFQPQAMQRLRRLAVRCAAEIPPDLPRAFALALDDAMTGDDALPWGYGRGEVTFTCEPDVSVYLDEPVRKLLQPYWDKRIALEWKRDLERRRAEYAEEQRGRRPADAQDGSAEPAEAQDGSAKPADAHDGDTGPTDTQDDDTGPAKAQDDSTGPAAGMPEALREERPPRQREAGAGGARRRPDSPAEQFYPLEPFPQPPAPRPAPGQRPATGQPGETTPAPGNPDSPGPPDA